MSITVFNKLDLGSIATSDTCLQYLGNWSGSVCNYQDQIQVLHEIRFYLIRLDFFLFFFCLIIFINVFKKVFSK